MIEILKNILGIGPKVDYRQLVQEGASIVDVRTKGEYAQGHVKGSINIPLGNLPTQLSRFKKDSVIITCCASGARSGQAKRLLKAEGFSEMHNGGGWGSLEYRMR